VGASTLDTAIEHIRLTTPCIVYEARLGDELLAMVRADHGVELVYGNGLKIDYGRPDPVAVPVRCQSFREPVDGGGDGDRTKITRQNPCMKRRPFASKHDEDRGGFVEATMRNVV
jgi:hypothetical protein